MSCPVISLHLFRCAKTAANIRRRGIWGTKLLCPPRAASLGGEGGLLVPSPAFSCGGRLGWGSELWKPEQDGSLRPHVSDRLIIEVDGGQHAQAQEYDQRRTQFLQSLAFGCCGFGTPMWLTNLEGWLQPSCSAFPHPNLPRKLNAGEGTRAANRARVLIYSTQLNPRGRFSIRVK